MEEKSLNIIVFGRDAEIVSNEILQIIKDEFAVDATVTTPEEAGLQEEVKSFDPFSFAALILAIPSAVLAVIDIAERIRKKKKTEQALKKVQQLTLKHEVNIKIGYPDGKIVEISQADTAELLDHFTEA